MFLYEFCIFFNLKRLIAPPDYFQIMEKPKTYELGLMVRGEIKQ